MIVISNIAEFNDVKERFDFYGDDLRPIGIKDNLYILGEEVLSDENFIDFFKEFTDYQIREVKQHQLQGLLVPI